MTPAFEQTNARQISDEWAYRRQWINHWANNDVLWLCTFHCSLEEDLAAATGENAIVAAWSLVRADEADFMSPALSLCWGRSSDRFLSGDGTGRRWRTQSRKMSASLTSFWPLKAQQRSFSMCGCPFCLFEDTHAHACAHGWHNIHSCQHSNTIHWFTGSVNDRKCSKASPRAGKRITAHKHGCKWSRNSWLCKFYEEGHAFIMFVRPQAHRTLNAIITFVYKKTCN